MSYSVNKANKYRRQSGTAMKEHAHSIRSMYNAFCRHCTENKHYLNMKTSITVSVIKAFSQVVSMMKALQK